MAESSGKLPQKKLRVTNPVFEKFRSHSQFRLLQKAVVTIAKGYNDTTPVCLKVLEANARSAVSFSNATCYVEDYHTDENFPVIVTARSLFQTGYIVLREYIDNCQSPKNPLHSAALEKLLDFLLLPTVDSPLFKKSSCGSEADWVIVLIQHLLSKLSLTDSYVYDGVPVSTDTCPCENKEKLICCKGNTSLGCVKGWRGKLDILMGAVPVKFAHSDEEMDGSDSSVVFDDSQSIDAEDKLKTFSKSDRNQMLAQTITFAFLKQKGLIPLIGLASSYIKLHFYDCEKDILLRCNTLDYIQQRVDGLFDVEVIVMLWLTLNYQLFCTGVPEGLEKYQAFFHEEIGCEMLNNYKKTQSPFQLCRLVNTDKDDLKLSGLPALDFFIEPDIVKKC